MVTSGELESDLLVPASVHIDEATARAQCPDSERCTRVRDANSIESTAGDEAACAAVEALAYLVFLAEGAMALVRDDGGAEGWRAQIGPTLRVHGPWNLEQFVDYFVITYGLDQRYWPLSRRAITRVFNENDAFQAFSVVRLRSPPRFGRIGPK